MITFKNMLFLFNTLSIISLYVSSIITFVNISKDYNGTNFIVGTYILFNGLVLSYVQLNNEKVKKIIDINIQNKLYYIIFYIEFICSLFMLTLSNIVLILGCLMLLTSILNISYAFFIDEEELLENSDQEQLHNNNEVLEETNNI